MVPGGISMEGRTDLHRLENGSLTAIRYRDEILEPMVRPYAGAVGPGFLLMPSMPSLMWQEYAGSTWRMKELIQLNGPHDHLT